MALYRSPPVQDLLLVMFLLSGLPRICNTDLARSTKQKEIETVITGSEDSDSIGTIVAPPTYPEGYYAPDTTTYIFILENVAKEGSVELIIEEFNIHSLSWILIRNSKYGGYIGRVLGRYDVQIQPPAVISTPTCCLRVEFQTGCCSEGDPKFAGLKATYRFVTTPGKGRRVSCEGEEVYNQLCNGECILSIYDCPCPQYGQFKCANGMCLTAEKVCDGNDDCGDFSDEKLCSYIAGRKEYEGMGSMYGFSVVISTVMSIVGTAFFLVFAIRCVENYRLHRRILKGDRRIFSGPVSYAEIWPRPEVGTLPSPRFARVFPISSTSQSRAPKAVLSVGRTPAVTVKPVPHHGHRDIISCDEVLYGSDSSYCESGFHGDDEGCMSSSSEGDDNKHSKIKEKIEEQTSQNSGDEALGCKIAFRIKASNNPTRCDNVEQIKDNEEKPEDLEHHEVVSNLASDPALDTDKDDHSDNPWKERTSLIINDR